MKVKALAKQLGKPTKELIEFLKGVDINVNSGSTKLDNNTIDQVKSLFAGEGKDSEEEEVTQFEIASEKISVKDLSTLIKVPLAEIMQLILNKGLLLSLNSELDAETAIDISIEAGKDLVKANKGVVDSNLKGVMEKIVEEEVDIDPSTLEERPPVITIMGHVDHGKTLLLDTIRKSNVVDKEAGGITQHIGAYQVTYNSKKLTFLDTPGHAAFTALRERGAQITDIVVLVVAANDGVKPQTIEAIHHAKAAGVPILVAINKMDLPGASVDKVKQELSEHDLLSEDWGGDVVMVPISAKKSEGISNLLDMILLTSEVLELKSTKVGLSRSIIIESKLSKTKGPVATVLVRSGILKVGDFFVVGNSSGKVKAMHDDAGNQILQASPGMPVEILGASIVPSPGDLLHVQKSEKLAKQFLEENAANEGASQVVKTINSVSLEALSDRIVTGEVRQINLVIKSDVNGSLEGIIHAIGQIVSEDVAIHIIHSATGPINESDIMLSAASEALCIGFNVEANSDALRLAEEKGVSLKLYTIIYQIIDDITRVIQGMFKIEFIETELGKLEVRQLFKYSKVGKIAGSYVKEGVIRRNAKVRLYRGEDKCFEGDIESLKRFNEDVKEVASGFECGIVLNGFNNVQVGDIVVCFELTEKIRK